MPVDMSGSIYAEYQRTLKRAQKQAEGGQKSDAAEAYRQAARLMTQYAAYAADGRIRADRLKKAAAHNDLADKISAGKISTRAPVVDAGAPGGEDDYESAVTALIYESPVMWDDIGGLESTKREIKATYGLSLARKPQGVKLRGWRNLLFYGPPGTGKTLLAAATSNGLDATFFNVKVSDVLSKYFGESTKLISALFAAARDRAPTVIFLDEFESLIPQRGGGESGVERRIISTLLAELDGLAQKGDDRYVLTIAATNLPWLIDKAMLSRFEKKVYIPLPDEAARRAILAIQIERNGYQTTLDLNELTRRAAGYSGREIERLCKEAINHMVARANPQLIHAVDQGREAVEAYQTHIEPLNAEDFDFAFTRAKPETTAMDLKKYDDWRNSLD
jgi:katanin p60 ATPase-containing subunit A1